MIQPTEISNFTRNFISLSDNAGVEILKVHLKSHTTSLMIYATISNDFKQPSLVDHSLPVGKYSTVTAYQVYDQARSTHVFEVLVNGILIVSMENTNPKVFSDVSVSTSKIGNNAALAMFKNLYILNIT